ncbi:MAG: hypothetical protein VX498_00465 [Myxococcota bacterium]|nr:hypothetical protein [Myxococcota bacterium]
MIATLVRGSSLAAVVVLCACAVAPETSSTSLRFDPSLETDFWAFPFPSDARVIAARRAGGQHPDSWGFPNPSDSEQLDQYLTWLSTQAGGFGLNTGSYFSFDGPVALPDWNDEAVFASQACEGPVRIVDVDPDSEARGSCRPAQVHWIDEQSQDPYLAPQTLVVAPWWGFPLQPQTTYAVVLVNAVDPEGDVIRAGDELLALLEGRSSKTELQRAYQPLADFLSEEVGWAGDGTLRDIGAATVFTTQDPTAELGSLVDAVRAHPDLPTWNSQEGLTLLDSDHPEFVSDYDMYIGSYTALNFQEGQIPYADLGGGFVFDNGVPIPQFEERIPFALALPLAGFSQPEAGWPVLLHSHGTGGDEFSHLTGGQHRPAKLAGARGFLSIGIPQPIHSDRWAEGNAVSISLYSFNYFNPDSGISMFRQGALDTVSLLRFLTENLAEGGELASSHPELRIDPDNIYFLGHSQGGLTGSMILPYADEVKAWVLSGAGAGVSMTVMQREDPVSIRDAMLTALDAPATTALFDLHPLVSLIQTIVEPSDPMNYAPLWTDRPTGSAASILLTEGIHDAQTPADTAEALAVAGGLPLARPHFERDIFGLELRAIADETLPYSGNAQTSNGTSITTGLAQFDSNHWTIFNTSEAAMLYTNFLWSQLRDGPPGELGSDFP